MCYIYLLHFEEPINPDHPCQHYTGSAADLAARIQQHWAGRRESCVLTAVAKERDIRFKVARVWRGGRDDERRLKSWKNGRALCPICSDRPLNVRDLQELSEHEIEQALMPF